jgi:hypothetical protein
MVLLLEEGWEDAMLHFACFQKDGDFSDGGAAAEAM